MSSCAQNQYLELEGVCASPMDFPAKRAAMIYGFFDESGGKNDGYVVVAGFVGAFDDWQKYLTLRHKAVGDRPALHMKDMRLGSETGARRHADLLRRLGSVPRKANLLPFAGSIKLAHTLKTKGTIADLALAGYNVALLAMVDGILQSDQLSKRERIEFTFEDQIEFAIPRASMFHSLRQSDQYKTCRDGRSRVGKDSSMEKGVLLEASDYLAHAILQQLIDPESRKATVTAPILQAYKSVRHVEVTKENVDWLIDIVFAGEIPEMNRAKRNYILEQMRKSLKA